MKSEKYFTVAKTISRWKINTPFENWLARKADNSILWKRLYVMYYHLFDSVYYQKGVILAQKEIERQMPNAHLPEGEGKNLVLDMIYCLHRFGATFEDYFVYKFYFLNAEGRRQFNTLKMQYGYCELVNGDGIRHIFEDKGECYRLFKDYFKRDLVVVDSLDCYTQFKEFVIKHPSFIYKPLNGHSGIGIKIYRNIDIDDTNVLDYIMEQGDGKFVVEELIEQAEGMALLHKESINTIRLFTFTIKEDVYIIGAAMRMGTGSSNVDNAGSGGIYACVDPTEGIVISMARDNAGNQYLKHPDSLVVLPGFSIPEWEEAVIMTKKMAQTIKGATVISWDLAYSHNGWLMVEGNDVGDQHLLQAPLQIGIKDKLISLIDKYYQD